MSFTSRTEADHIRNIGIFTFGRSASVPGMAAIGFDAADRGDKGDDATAATRPPTPPSSRREACARSV